MEQRLRQSTRTVALVVACAAVLAAADLVDLQGFTSVSTAGLGVLAVAAAVCLRLRSVGVSVTDDTVLVRNLLGSHELPRGEVVAFVPGSFRSAFLLADGSSLPSLLRDTDVTGDLLASPTGPELVIALDEIAAA